MKVATTFVVGFVIWIATAALVYLWPGLVDRVNAEIIKQMLGQK